MANPHGNEAKLDCCGGVHKVSYSQQGIREEVIEEDMPEVLMVFNGHRTGAFSIAGPVSKRLYRFSIFHREVMVDERDIPGLLSKYPDFSVAGVRVIRQPSRPEQRLGVAVAEGRITGGSPQNTERARLARQAAEESTHVISRPASNKPPRRSQVQDGRTTKPVLPRLN